MSFWGIENNANKWLTNFFENQCKSVFPMAKYGIFNLLSGSHFFWFHLHIAAYFSSIRPSFGIHMPPYHWLILNQSVYLLWWNRMEWKSGVNNNGIRQSCVPIHFYSIFRQIRVLPVSFELLLIEEEITAHLHCYPLTLYRLEQLDSLY